jgi:DNA-binding beta-propeller fold protein YncE
LTVIFRIAMSLLLVLSSATVAADAPPLRPIGVIPLGEVKGRIDHLAIDPAGQRLFVAALGNNTVEVIDLAAGRVARRLGGMDEPQGVRFLPDSKTLVVASGGDGKARFYDAALKLLPSVNNLDDADNVRFDSAAKRVYIGYGNGALAVCDPAGKLLESIKLAGHPESFQLESAGPRIFVNVPSARIIEVVDRAKMQVIAQWPVKDGEANFPMALDEPHHRLLVVCRKPAKLLVFDTETGAVVASVDACGDADDIWLDPAAARIYITGGEGCISVIEQSDADHYRALARIPTAAGARTSFFDAEARRLYVAVPRRGSQSPEIRMFQASR